VAGWVATRGGGGVGSLLKRLAAATPSRRRADGWGGRGGRRAFATLYEIAVAGQDYVVLLSQVLERASYAAVALLAAQRPST